MNAPNIEHPLFNWIPYKLIEKDDAVFFEWLYLGEKRFTEPFFEDTLARCRSLPYNSTGYKILSSSENLLEWADEVFSVSLSGLLFHISRCGSTMIIQLLVVRASNIVISEAPVIDQILRHEQLSITAKKNLIVAVFKFFGQKRFQEEQHLIIKMDAWHLLQIEHIRLFFPDTPFIILYRNPAAVLKSHIHLRGMHMVPHMLPFNIVRCNETDMKSVSLNKYGIMVLKKYYEAILHFASIDKNILLTDYQQGMENIILSLNLFLNIHITKKSFGCMKERLKSHSKYPENAFTDNKDILLNIDLTIVNNLYNQINALSTTAEKK